MTPEMILVDADALAEMLGISRRHLKRLEASGRLPAPIRLGRAVRWNLTEVREWAAAGCPGRARWEILRGEGGAL